MLREADESASFEMIPAPEWRAVPSAGSAPHRAVVYWVLHGKTESMWVLDGSVGRDAWRYLAPGHRLSDFASLSLAGSG